MYITMGVFISTLYKNIVIYIKYMYVVSDGSYCFQFFVIFVIDHFLFFLYYCIE